MIKIDAAQTIGFITDKLLLAFSPEKEGLIFGLTASLEELGHKTRCADVRIVLQRSSAYTKVFVYTEQNMGRPKRLDLIKSDEWAMISNHDSCWRSAIDSYLTKVYFELAKTVNPGIPPIKMVDRSHIDIFEFGKSVKLDIRPRDKLVRQLNPMKEYVLHSVKLK